ncbi:hypothetical protein [Helicobacter pylori]|uniref:hypothetical protein n=1 Tax=Helicobacter pylori TaxID=210 RepID=UPI000EAB7455|nr:hypothetical protein [Helicobacter pylori]RKV38423.1 hypothetical protein DEE33_06935 [Helicobacter pylori]WQX75212.1 hypothetical protein KVK95_06275 [Helicobacter pylori]WRE40186.1 hypothetical protein KVD20_06135 [Helicobacter pylori]
MDDNKNSDIEYIQGSQVKMEQFEVGHASVNRKLKRQEQPLDESFKPKHASINPKPQQIPPKDGTKK